MARHVDSFCQPLFPLSAQAPFELVKVLDRCVENRERVSRRLIKRRPLRTPRWMLHMVYSLDERTVDQVQEANNPNGTSICPGDHTADCGGPRPSQRSKQNSKNKPCYGHDAPHVDHFETASKVELGNAGYSNRNRLESEVLNKADAWMSFGLQ